MEWSRVALAFYGRTPLFISPISSPSPVWYVYACMRILQLRRCVCVRGGGGRGGGKKDEVGCNSEKRGRGDLGMVWEVGEKVQPCTQGPLSFFDLGDREGGRQGGVCCTGIREKEELHFPKKCISFPLSSLSAEAEREMLKDLFSPLFRLSLLELLTMKEEEGRRERKEKKTASLAAAFSVPSLPFWRGKKGKYYQQANEEKTP